MDYYIIKYILAAYHFSDAILSTIGQYVLFL